MRRTRKNRTVPASPRSAAPRFGAAVATIEPAAETAFASPRETFAAAGAKTSDAPSERKRHLEVAIRQRIESRLPGRVRNLEVRALDDVVMLEGQCATYYTKQLAQHAALGILDDEHLENALVVSVPR